MYFQCKVFQREVYLKKFTQEMHKMQRTVINRNLLGVSKLGTPIFILWDNISASLNVMVTPFVQGQDTPHVLTF